MHKLFDFFKTTGFLMVCFVVLSCSNHKHPDKTIFRYNESAGIGSLDPAFAKNQAIMWPVHMLYNTLVEINPQMQIVPSLAKSWQMSDSGKKISFVLRNDVYFHDDPAFKNGKGRKFTAADVVFSFQRLTDKKVASPGAWIFNNRVDTIEPFIAVNDTLFEVHLSKPCPQFLGILSMQYCAVVAQEAVLKYGDEFRRHPVGTGQFCLRAWDEGQSLVLAKNEHYFERDSQGVRLPYLDGVSIGFIESKASEFLSFRQHKIDFINDIDVAFKDELLTRTGELRKQWKGKMYLQKHPYLNTEYLGILSDTGESILKLSPLKQKKIRQAIAYGTNRKKLLMYLRNSLGNAAESGFLPMGLQQFDSNVVKGYRYNPSKAMKLLKEAGFDRSHPMPLIKLQTVPNYAAIGSFMVNEWKQLGINVVLETVQKSLLLDQMSKSQALFFRGSWIADYPDPSNFMDVFYGGNPAPPNYTRFHHAEFDKLYEQSNKEAEMHKRNQLFHQMDSIIMEECPVIPLWYDMVVRFVDPAISGFYPNAMNMLELKTVKKNIRN